MIRILFSLFGGIALAFLLFVFMAFLVSVGEVTLDKSDRMDVDFSMVKPDDETKTKERKPPKKPEPPKTPPPPTAERTKSNEKPVAQIMDLRMDTSSLGLGDGLSLGGVMGGVAQIGTGGDGEAIPVATLPPRYPVEAARDGIEGYVCFNFYVEADGSVSDLSIYDAKPRRVFDSEARRALSKWKFKPSIEDGKPLRSELKKYCLDFKLDQG